MAAHLVQDQTTYESFISSSIPQLKDKVPSIYWESLFRKLKSEVSTSIDFVLMKTNIFECTCTQKYYPIDLLNFQKYVRFYRIGVTIHLRYIEGLFGPP